MNIFDPDGWFYKWGTKLFDLIIISVITMVISSLTAFILGGTAFTAFFYTVDKVVVHDRGKLLKSYWKSFKMNLKQGVLLSLFIIIVSSVLAYIYYTIQSQGIPSRGLTIALYFGGVELIIITLYGFVLLAKFNLTIKEVIIRALIFGHKHFLTTITIVSVIALNVLAVIYIHPLFAIVGVGISGYIISRLILEKVLVKYSEPGALTDFDMD